MTILLKLRILLIIVAVCFTSVALHSKMIVRYNLIKGAGNSILHITQIFPESDGSFRLAGIVEPKQVGYNPVYNGLFVLKLVPDPNTANAFVLEYYKDLFENGEFNLYTPLRLYGYGKWYKTPDGGLTTIDPNYCLQPLNGDGMFMDGVPMVFKFNATGDCTYKFFDASWIIGDRKEGSSYNTNLQCVPWTRLPQICILPDSSFLVANYTYDLRDTNFDGTPNPNYYMKPYRIVLKHYNKDGVFQTMAPIIGIDTNKIADSIGFTVEPTGLFLLNSNLYMNIHRRDYYKKVGTTIDSIVTTNYCVKLVDGKVAETIPKNISWSHINNNGNLVAVYSDQIRNPYQLNDTTIKNFSFTVNSPKGDFPTLTQYAHHTGGYQFSATGSERMNHRGDYLMAGYKRKLIKDENGIDDLGYEYWIAGILSADGKKIRVFDRPGTEPAGSFHRMFEYEPNKYVLFGQNGNYIISMFLHDSDFVELNTYPTQPVSINDKLTTNQTTAKLYPNPTTNDATNLSLELHTASHLTITLTNTTGQTLLTLHDGFATAGKFEKTISTTSLPKGSYYIKITTDNQTLMQPLMKN